MHRRTFLARCIELTAFGGLAVRLPLPAWAAGGTGMSRADAVQDAWDLRIGPTPVEIGDRRVTTAGINGSVPGPLVRLREGDEVVLNVSNALDETSSIHWHGILLPYDMDGVPGISFAGIAPGATFSYRFPVRQNGTYWYHSHSGLQEQAESTARWSSIPPARTPWNTIASSSSSCRTGPSRTRSACSRT